MKFRWTMAQLSEFSDNKVVRGILAERIADLNPYTPLAVRLKAIYAKVDEQVQAEDK